jgi:ubiquinone/menaquinone biosynthesis C-methylase UbiE
MGRSHTVHAVEAGAWNAGAAAWAERVRSHDWSAHDEAIRELIPPPQGVTLDVGCGEGRWTRALRAAGYDVSGFDRSDALIELARGADPHGRYHVAPVEALPVGDAEAQFVLCVNLLPHVDDLRGAVGELARVLPPGGVLVAGHRHPVAEAGSTDAETGELRLRSYFAHEPHAVALGAAHVFHQHRTIEDYLRTFISHGFQLDDIREVPDATGSTPAYLDLRLIRR